MRQQITERVSWHVMSRGVRRLEVFSDDADYRAFLDRLDDACGKTSVGVLAYALMPNHYHLLLEGSTADLAGAMHRANRSYARAYNTKRGQRGHVFEGAYKSFVMRGEFRVAFASRYIHLNPVAAKLAKKPADWKWSSYAAYTGGRTDLKSLRPAAVLQFSGGKAEYMKDVQAAMEFLPKKHPTNAPEALWEAEARWIQSRVEADPPAGIDAKALALFVARQAGIPPRVLAPVLGFSSTTYASIVVGRWEDRLDRDAKFAETVKQWRAKAGL